MTRGYTDEADRILNYLVRIMPYFPLKLKLTPFKEFGIFDALQRQYLRSFIFAIYLVSDLPFPALVLLLICCFH